LPIIEPLTSMTCFPTNFWLGRYVFFSVLLKQICPNVFSLKRPNNSCLNVKICVVLIEKLYHTMCSRYSWSVSPEG
jgi:hypothetical protein